MSYTLGDAKQWLRDRNNQATSASAIRDYVRISNYALSKLRMALKIESDRKKTTLSFAAAYQTGTIQISAANATVVTGTSTVFTSAMIGKFLYVGGETRGYRINTYTSGTILGVQPYLGTLTATDTSFMICDREEILPTDFRDIDKADQGALQYKLTPIKEVEIFDEYSARLRYNYIPRFYGVEYDWYISGSTAPFTSGSSASEKRAFFRVYPEPLQAVNIDIWYYGGQPTLSADTDTFGLPNLPEAQTAIEAYLKAELVLANGDVSAYQILSQDAAYWANRLAVLLQPLRDDYPGRYPYRAPDENRYPYKGQFAPGVITNP